MEPDESCRIGRTEQSRDNKSSQLSSHQATSPASQPNETTNQNYCNYYILYLFTILLRQLLLTPLSCRPCQFLPTVSLVPPNGSTAAAAACCLPLPTSNRQTRNQTCCFLHPRFSSPAGGSTFTSEWIDSLHSPQFYYHHDGHAKLN